MPTRSTTTNSARQRLLQLGPSTLSTTELIANLITPNQSRASPIATAEAVLDHYQSLSTLFNDSPYQWQHVSGLTLNNYCKLHAASELWRRCQVELATPLLTLNNYQAVQRFCFHKLCHLQQEVFACLFLNNRTELINFDILFYGSISSANIYPREIIKRALFHNAAKLICTHNHPSGNTKPSQLDLDLTATLTAALQWVDIELLDHIIVGSQGCYSINTS